MPRVRVRLWLPDRPGALGAVASRIGSVKADVVGIEILEQGAGRAIDDLVVEVPDDSLLDLMVAEVGEVDGVDVEEVTLLDSEAYDPDLDALEAAAALVALEERGALLGELCRVARATTGAGWVCVVDLDAGGLAHAEGPAPGQEWLQAFVLGSWSSDLVRDGRAGPDDLLWADLGGWGAVVLGREAHPFRERERRRVRSLVCIAAARHAQLGEAGR